MQQAAVSAPSTSSATATESLAAKFGDAFATAVVGSPLYPFLMESARKTMKDAAERVGVQWDARVAELSAAKDWTAALEEVISSSQPVQVPDYYLKKFHAYEEGNLSFEAAFEQELASVAVGVRNYPDAAGVDGENKMRNAFFDCLEDLGVCVPDQSIICDFGCGTGRSTVDIAKKYSQAATVMGIDLSPHMVCIAKHLLQEKSADVKPDIQFVYADAAATAGFMPDASVSLVTLNLVVHELPDTARRAVFAEAYRILKPGGSLGVLEMDPDGPGYVKLRGNAVLYSFMKSTEPYLDEYFRSFPNLKEELLDAGFAVVRQTCASPRHMTLVGFKGGAIDLRADTAARAKAGIR
jgi:ubiquinone/menaquinone biosynthesis C-methylase UbiE